jgi:hypothetical protein
MRWKRVAVYDGPTAAKPSSVKEASVKAIINHSFPALGRIQTWDSFGLSSDESPRAAGVWAGVARSVAIAPATPASRGVRERRGAAFVAERQFPDGIGAAGWTPRASIMIATRGPLRRAARVVAWGTIV